jgi:cobalt transporter subunit CbtB
MTARTVSSVSSLPLSRRLAAGLVLVFVGATLFYAVGLSSIAVAHNTAHDTRHAIGFPCH